MMRQSDNVPGTEKMDYEAWSALLRPLYGRHSLEGDELNTFSGWLRRLSVCGLTAVDICCNAHRFERTHRDVRFDNRDHYKDASTTPFSFNRLSTSSGSKERQPRSRCRLQL